MTGPTVPTRFGEFTFDPSSGELVGPGETVRLAPQVAATLQLLLSRAGELVSRAEFHEKLWPDTNVEFDQGLNFCIRQLRQALSDDAEQPRYIETLPRRGYRFIAPVNADGAEPSSLSETSTAAYNSRPGSPIRWIGAVIAVLGVMVLSWPGIDRSPMIGSKARGLAVLPFDLNPADPSLEPYRANVVEQLVTSLTREAPREFAVMGPSFTARFPGMQTSPDSIRAILGAAYVLSGALRRTPTGTRVFAQLIRTVDRKHVFAAVLLDSTNSPSRMIAIADSVSRGVRNIVARDARIR
jgi:DNA-binding winged helix-turn-helix (wHTH) protein/TolB-like protein